MLALDAQGHFYLSSKINIGGTMPKAIRFSPLRKKEILLQLTIIQVNLDSVRMEMMTGNKEPWSIPVKDRLFNAALANERIQVAFGKKVP